MSAYPPEGDHPFSRARATGARGLAQQPLEDGRTWATSGAQPEAHIASLTGRHNPPAKSQFTLPSFLH